MEFTAPHNGRLDTLLMETLPEFSRHRIKRGIAGGAVRVNGVVAAKAGAKVKLGAFISADETIFPPAADKRRPLPAPKIPLEILYEDDDCLVVNKPAGLLTHPTATRLADTLAGALLARYPSLATVGENPLRPGIVHRLDENTSGLLVFAKTQIAFKFLKRQFIGRSVQKTYLALVEGVPVQKEGVIEYAIRPSSKNPAKRVAIKRVLPHGTEKREKKSVREAETRYRVVESFGKRYALMELKPKTGRTHQIRVHLAAIGHPVVGDTLYGSRTRGIRQLLHAARLEFIRPNRKSISLTSPLPHDFRLFLKKLK
ncbi:MAG: RluA family pseudouridine synthase [Candidatus Brennerbacteria bacterium]|nr:RluA family pseudouridine synthase [Candidatus Brennerbacteria bacterium]